MWQWHSNLLSEWCPVAMLLGAAMIQCARGPPMPSNPIQDQYLSCFSRFWRVDLYCLAFSESLSKVRQTNDQWQYRVQSFPIIFLIRLLRRLLRPSTAHVHVCLFSCLSIICSTSNLFR
ncbi:hypothetical protein ARMSODRAFT_950243 [Armillaria solidipes]|uniref:Secreted protein n=1 Tax=Armillaria solidipes TaxID=1076256 RepID=A0A2H3BYH2_9AGAR|nr:hypothetical protein ARMSODRAFT_950243 [Armillaria solidipes]